LLGGGHVVFPKHSTSLGVVGDAELRHKSSTLEDSLVVVDFLLPPRWLVEELVAADPQDVEEEGNVEPGVCLGILHASDGVLCP